MSTVPSEQLKRMLSSHILTRVLAHGECTGRQIDVLYRGEAINEIGRKRRRNGQRIIAMRLEVYCANVSEKNLNKVFGNRDLKYDRKATIEALLVKA
jgi:hypothetical protein